MYEARRNKFAYQAVAAVFAHFGQLQILDSMGYVFSFISNKKPH